MRRIVYQFSKLKREDVEAGNYNQLVEKMSKLYGYQQFKTKSSLALLEIHHHHRIFKEGDRVLNLCSVQPWAEMVVKYTSSPYQNPNVITISPNLQKSIKGSHIIKGSLEDIETRVKMVELLNGKNFNVALMNILPSYTCFVDIDGFKLCNSILSTLSVLDNFLVKGGTFVCKSFKCSETKQLDKSLENIFKEVYKHQVSFMSAGSPMFYYVLKGFGMSKKSLLFQEFMAEFNHANLGRKQIIRKYEQKGLNAQMLIRNQMEEKISKMMDQKIPEDQILRHFSKQDFLNPYQYIQKWKEFNSIIQNGTRQDVKQYVRKEFGDSYAQNLPFDVPEDELESVSLLQKIQEEYKKEQSSRRGRRVKNIKKQPENQLLGRDEVYMKGDDQDGLESITYLENEVNEDINFEQQQNYMNDIEKFKKVVPGFKQFFDKYVADELSLEQISKFYGTHELYNPSHDQLKKELEKSKAKDQQFLQQQRFKQSQVDGKKHTVKGTRARPYVKNRQFKKK